MGSKIATFGPNMAKDMPASGNWHVWLMLTMISGMGRDVLEIVTGFPHQR